MLSVKTVRSFLGLKVAIWVKSLLDLKVLLHLCRKEIGAGDIQNTPSATAGHLFRKYQSGTYCKYQYCITAGLDSPPLSLTNLNTAWSIITLELAERNLQLERFFQSLSFFSPGKGGYTCFQKHLLSLAIDVWRCLKGDLWGSCRWHGCGLWKIWAASAWGQLSVICLSRHWFYPAMADLQAPLAAEELELRPAPPGTSSSLVLLQCHTPSGTFLSVIADSYFVQALMVGKLWEESPALLRGCLFPESSWFPC